MCEHKQVHDLSGPLFIRVVGHHLSQGSLKEAATESFIPLLESISALQLQTMSTASVAAYSTVFCLGMTCKADHVSKGLQSASFRALAAEAAVIWKLEMQ